MPTHPHRDPKILIWDIESTGLRATFGTILCIGYKWFGKPKVHCPTIMDDKNSDMLADAQLVEKFAEVYNQCDYHVTWYGERFDKKMVASKMIRAGMKPLAPKPHLDLWKTSRKYFNLHSNRLAVWQQYLGCQHEKTAIDFDAWRRAAIGHKPSLKEVVHHCKLDVLVLEEMFVKFRPWLENEPANRLFHPEAHHMACGSCGSHRVTRQGFKVARTRRYQQWQCQDCGKWSKTPASDKNVKLTFVGDES